MSSKMRALAAVQCTWGIFQTLAGFFVFLSQSGRTHFVYRSAVVTVWKYRSSVSLGAFVFVSDNDRILIAHEYGHCVQSLMLGPLYLPAIGLPSIVWAGAFKKLRRERDISYYGFYTEKWADLLAKKVTKTNIDRGE